MSILAVPTSTRRIFYPETDGKPMAENTLQFDWIVKITGNLRRLFINDPNVFIAGDLFWYPIEGHPEIVVAPDTLAVFGRPPGHRGSYRQWEEGGIAPQVVFEVLSPGNRFGEMTAKYDFYRRHGVEEYYMLDPEPDRLELAGFLRQGDDLARIENMNGHVSPRLKIKFEITSDALRIVGSDGRSFETFEDSMQSAELGQRKSEEQRRQAEQLRQAAEEQRRQAEQLRQAAEERAKEAEKRAEELRAELDRLRSRQR
jgi:Uma2 family endonuclease